jgi:hypothetical protein
MSFQNVVPRKLGIHDGLIEAEYITTSKKKEQGRTDIPWHGKSSVPNRHTRISL